MLGEEKQANDKHRETQTHKTLIFLFPQIIFWNEKKKRNIMQLCTVSLAAVDWLFAL